MRQLFLGTRRDRKVSNLPAPPRALTGNRALPVYGHTRLFTKFGGDVAHMFPSHMQEWICLPKSWSRQLGDIFSIFIWGQWRVVIKGTERTERILNCPDLKDGWAWTPPVSLLGRNCLCLMEEEEGDFLRSLLAQPLSQRSVERHAPEFADIAEQFVDDLLSGKFKKHKAETERERAGSYDSSLHDFSDEETGTAGSHSLDGGRTHKIKWNALRSYTFDLVDGPVLRTSKWSRISEQPNGERTSQRQSSFDAIPEHEETKDEDPDRSMMMLWMERLKAALCVIKMTFGAEWMYVWMLNEYGRAVNGRMHIYKVISAHVSERSKQLPVRRLSGHDFRDPVLTSFPLFTMAENVYHRHENVVGDFGKDFRRPRSQSLPNVSELLESQATEWNGPREFAIPPPSRELGPPAVPPPPPPPPPPPESPWLTSSPPMSAVASSPTRKRADSSPQILETVRKQPSARSPRPILDEILRQKDGSGKGMTEVVTTEISILLWMIMDAGNAWTAMALHLLSMDHQACDQVQQELDDLTRRYGRDKLFTPRVMRKMTALDALVWESIRLCPSFLGGMKVVTRTIELLDDGIQLPKGTNVIFCQPTETSFNLEAARGKRPENLVNCYPCKELHGFLPFRGLEIPIMVLQSKVLLAVLLQKCSPFVSKRRTFIRRVKQVLQSHRRIESPLDSLDGNSSAHGPSPSSHSSSKDSFDDKPRDIETAHTYIRASQMTQTEAMKVFTKIPFPEPRRVIHVTERELR